MTSPDYYMRAMVFPRRGGPKQIVVVFDDYGDWVSGWDESPQFPAGQRFSEAENVPAHKAETWIGKLRQHKEQR